MFKIILFFLCLVPAWAQPMLGTDSRQLPRDYTTAELQVVPPKLFDQVPWETVADGVRRRVLFTDRLTMVLLEIEGEPDAEPLKTHYHPHDQITYLLSGKARIHLDGEERVVEPGAAYCVPSNVHHGLKPLSQKVVIVECFTPTREDFRTILGSNDLKAFVYHWFALLDRAAPFAALEPHLDKTRLEMTFPEQTLRTPEEFEAWWMAVPKGEHKVGDVGVSSLSSTRYRIELDVEWRPHGGDWMSFHQVWTVETETGVPKILTYAVSSL
jgi:unsaturated pyranuronate lyase